MLVKQCCQTVVGHSIAHCLWSVSWPGKCRSPWYYSSEFKTLQVGKRLKKSHALSRLTAIIDHAGILRVGALLQNSHLDADSKHIISHAHSRTMHGGTQLTLSLIRKSCWIVGGRAPVKSFIQKYLTCARIRGVRAQQLMGQLPASRVTPSPVFENTGVDYAGPVSLKFNQGFSTSAIHLEVATDYSSEAFIKAYRRFISRPGICKTLRSDCGSNFKGADVLLKKLFDQSTHQFKELQRLLTNDGTGWIFNPPGAPHMGGKWEAAVKSMKHHLRRTIADTVLSYEDFSTLLAQVEAILNSRPFSALSDDPEDISALTSGHFIHGAALTTIPESTLTHLPDSRLFQLQRIQARLQTFWDRWSAECLQAHQLTSKWKHSHSDIKQGSLVLLTDERYPPSKWPLARVTQLHPGVDGLTRVVTIKTATATLTRPVTKLALLPISGKSSSSRRTRCLIAANHSPNLLEKEGRMFEIPANFNWRGLKDGVGKTDTIIIIDPQTDRRRQSHQKIIIQGRNHSQSSSSVVKRKSSCSKSEWV
jgi:hypothetical protein